MKNVDGIWVEQEALNLFETEGEVEVGKVRVNVCNLGVKLLNGAAHCIEIMNVSQSSG